MGAELIWPIVKGLMVLAAIVIVWKLIEKGGKKKVIADILERGAEKRDEVDEILAQPPRKGANLLASWRARAERMRKPLGK